MVWKRTPDDTKTVTVKVAPAEPGPPTPPYKPPPGERPPNWFAKMRAWASSAVGRDLPETPLEKL